MNRIGIAALGLLPALVVSAGVSFGLAYFWLTILAYHAVCAIVPALFRERGGLQRGSRPWALMSIVLSAVIAAGAWFAGERARAWGIFPTESKALLVQIEPWVPLAIWSIVVNPFMEEFYWRGFVLPRTGVAASAALFGFMHFAGLAVHLPCLQSLLLCLPATVAGFFWGWMRRRYDSLWPCVITHLAADAGILLVMQRIRAG